VANTWSACDLEPIARKASLLGSQRALLRHHHAPLLVDSALASIVSPACAVASRGWTDLAGEACASAAAAAVGSRNETACGPIHASELSFVAVSNVGLCPVCKKQGVYLWTCLICEEAGERVSVCSGVCKRRHQRDGRHRRNARALRERTPPRSGR
jgi:hypothetical protein